MNCEWCSLEIKENFSSQRFCSRKCISTYVSSFNKNIRIKICNLCSNTFEVNKRINKINECCINCKQTKKLKKCKVCGLTHKKSENSICNRPQLLTILIEFGLNKKSIGNKKIFTELKRIKKKLTNDYYTLKLSTPLICKKYNIKGHNRVLRLFKFLEINTRNLSESVNNFIINNQILNTNLSKTYKYKSGVHLDWENKEHFYRSSYELDYYKILDEQKISYETEKLRILYFDTDKKRERVSIPDIYIPNQNLIIEIKSNYTHNEQNWKDRVVSYKKLKYKVKLILDRIEIIF